MGLLMWGTGLTAFLLSREGGTRNTFENRKESSHGGHGGHGGLPFTVRVWSVRQ
jgi:hypothetical protein